MESECVEEALEGIHAHEHTESEGEEQQEQNPEGDTAKTDIVNTEGDNQDVL